MTPSPIPPDPGRSRRGGVAVRPVVLADGQTWGLAMPELRYRPETRSLPPVDADTRPPLRVVSRLGYPWPIEKLAERLGAACRADPDAAGNRERFDALMALAAALLRRAHDLDSIEAATLLALDADSSARLVDAVLDLAVGLASPFDPGGADA